jgi:hypothetical protein
MSSVARNVAPDAEAITPEAEVAKRLRRLADAAETTAIRNGPPPVGLRVDV